MDISSKKDVILFKFIQLLLLISGIYIFSACDFSKEEEEEEIIFNDTLTVIASAYNSLPLQTEGNPKITAWGDTLSPDVPSIAVSRDLLKKGLDYSTPVKIEGFDGVFVVNDKMHPRWRNKIDIYMGVDKKKAMRWGRRKVEIYFPSEAAE